MIKLLEVAHNFNSYVQESDILAKIHLFLSKIRSFEIKSNILGGLGY